MMAEWLNIALPIITALIPAGGLTGFFLFRGKKKELEINNLQKVLEIVQAERTEKSDELKDVVAALRKKEEYIEQLQRDKSILHGKLDRANSRVAVLATIKCDKIACAERHPPFGSGSKDIMDRIKEETLLEE